jgi:GxxExxY protein
MKKNTDKTDENTDKHGLKMTLRHQKLTEEIINVFYHVYNELGYGFLEKVYQNSMFFELKSRGFFVEAQKQINVYFKGVQVGEYYADLVINNLIIVELKAAEVIAPEHESQLINYLRGTEIEVGLLFNFGKKPEFRRKIFDNDKKKLPVKNQ